MRLWSLIIAVAIAVGGCVGTDVGNPPDDRRIAATLEFEALDESAATIGTRTTLVIADGTVFDEAWISVEALRVRRCGEPGEEVVEGPFFVELVSGDVRPTSPIIATEPTTICSLFIEVAPPSSAAPPQLDGRALFVRGRTVDGEFTVESGSSRRLPYTGSEFVVQGDGRFVAVFDPTQWVDQLIGTPVVTDANPAVVNAFWSAMRKGSRIVHDLDADGDLSEDDLRATVALPDPP